MKIWMLGAALALGAFTTATSSAHEHFHLRHEHTYPRYHPPSPQPDMGNASRPSPDSPPSPDSRPSPDSSAAQSG